MGLEYFVMDAEGMDDFIRLKIDGVLDLHTFKPQEVKDLVLDYLDACREQGITQVRIIHGKGIGTVRSIVHSTLQKVSFVRSFRTADEAAGGWGATVVELQPQPKK